MLRPLLAVLALSAASAHAQPWRCTTAGKTVYQDTPCAATAAASKVQTWGGNAPGGYLGANGAAAGGTNRRDRQPNIALAGPAEASQLVALYRRWIDAEQLALSTARAALATPVAAMQAINRETEAIRPAACVQPAHAALLKLTGASTKALIQFMGREELTGMVYQIVDRSRMIDSFETEVARAPCGAAPPRS